MIVLMRPLPARLLLLLLAFPGCKSDAATPEATGTAAAAKSEGATASPSAKARIFFTNLNSDQQVKSPVEICFGVEGMTLAPKGNVKAGEGHHHILIDAPLPAAMDQPIPMNETHIHMGDGSECKTLELEPGPHTLRGLFGDGAHIPHDPPLSTEVAITVVE